MSDKNNPKVIRKRSYGGALPLVLSLLVIVVSAAAIAGVWQAIASKNAEEPPFEPGTQVVDNPSSAAPSSSTSSSEPDPEPSAPIYDYTKPVPASARVRSDYFDDAAFVGDSITTGIEGYNILPDTNVVATIGVNLNNVQSAAVFEVKAGEKITFLNALSRIAPKKIYVMLGANGLALLSEETTVNLYGQFLDKIIAQHPDAVIYVQSIFPVDEALFKANYQGELSNAKVDETNRLLQKLAAEKNVYYLDISSVFKDENGSLMAEATQDGLHFKNGEYYTKWIDFLKEHTID